MDFLNKFKTNCCYRYIDLSTWLFYWEMWLVLECPWTCKELSAARPLGLPKQSSWQNWDIFCSGGSNISKDVFFQNFALGQYIFRRIWNMGNLLCIPSAICSWVLIKFLEKNICFKTSYIMLLSVIATFLFSWKLWWRLPVKACVLDC